MSSRKRHYESDKESDDGDDTRRNVSSEEEEEGEIEDSRSRRKKAKKSKKHKKEKKHKSRKRRKRSESGERAGSTDREGGSTPEVEAGEVLEISDEEEDNERSRSSSVKREHRDQDRSTKHGKNSPKSRSRSPPSVKREKSYSPPPIRSRDSKPLKLRRSPSPQENSGSASKGGSASVESLSIEETNKLRASLGLPPLKINKPVKEEATKEKEKEKEKDDTKEGVAIPNSDVRHKPAENLTEKSNTEKMRERLLQRKMKRQQENKLLTVKTLGDDDETDDTSKWLQRQKKKEKEKKAAAKRAKMLEELDDDFGVGNIVKEDTERSKAASYGSQSLAGLKVQHDANKFKDGKTVILTLEDADILDEKAEDTLVNVNMIDDEKVDKNKENLKKLGGYNPYDQEEIDEDTGELRRKNMLDKYDEEIDGQKKKSFTIGNQGTYSEAEEIQMRRDEIRQKLAKRNVETLEMPQQKVASDYYTEEEVVKFKKPKKKKKVKRKMLKADDLLPLENDSSAPEVKKERGVDHGTRGSVPMDVDEEDVKPNIAEDNELSKIKVDDDDMDLQAALRKARKLKQRKQFDEDRTAKLLEENGLTTVKDEPDNDELGHESTGAEFISTFSDDKQSSNIILNETSEFCRHLGAWRSHEGTGLGESVSKDILDFEQSLSSTNRRKAVKSDSEDDDDDDDPMEGSGRRFKRDAFSSLIEEDSKKAVILDEEPDIQTGIAAAIRLASNKGYWETEDKATKASNLKHLEAKHYTIEDKNNDDRGGRRGDRYGGPTQSFQEKAGYKPNVKLEYIDDSGRILNRKEAFRHLSHKFHGKGSGKLKSEKRMKKIEEESMMKNMSSTDTPLNTLEKLRNRQKQGATPYIILSGNKVQATDLKKK